LGFFFFWGTYLGLTMPGPNGQPMPVPPAAGFFLVGWTVYVVILWIASAKANLTVFLTFIVFLITLILLDIAFMAPAPGLVTVGGYAGIVLAAFAWYISAAGLINHMFGRTVIPLGGPLGESS
jgi:succinate-acetate transporter protein